MEKIELETSLNAKELAYLFDMPEEKCQYFMEVNNLTGDEALEQLYLFQQAKEANLEVPLEIVGCLRNAGIYAEVAKKWGTALDVHRGGNNNFGFIFEDLHAADARIKGQDIVVLGDNGISDFCIYDVNGHVRYAQAKAVKGSKGTKYWEPYEGQSVVVDKENMVLKQSAEAAGKEVEMSAISADDARNVSRIRAKEATITGNKFAPISSTLISAHNAGLASAKLVARVGVSMKLGENIYDLMSGDKDFFEAAQDVVVDGAVMVGSAYIGSASFTVATTAISQTAVGGIASTATGAIGSTAIGGAIKQIGFKVFGTIAGANAIPMVFAFASIGFGKRYIVAKELEHQERLKNIAKNEAISKEIQKYREEFEKYLQFYFKDYQNCFDVSLATIDSAFVQKDSDGIVAGANQITEKLGGEVKYKTVKEARKFIFSDEPDCF